MKKTITFGQNVAVLERSKSTATITITPIPENTPLPTQIALMADELNESELVDVIQILTGRGKIAFLIAKNATNADIIDVVCDAIACVYDTDTTVSNERSETVV